MAKTEEQANLPEGAEADPAGVDLPEDWKISDGDEPLNVYQRMVIARQHMGYIQKKKQPGGLPFATVNHDEVTVAAQSALDKANVLAIPTVLEHGKTGNTTWARCQITFVNPDNPKEQYSVVMFGEGNDNQDKGPGKAISYAIKYALLKALMGETGEKDADMQNVDTEAPEPAHKEDPDERQELFDQLKERMGMYDLDPAYVRKEMAHRTGGRKQTVKDIREVIASIEESPALWRDPETQGE